MKKLVVTLTSLATAISAHGATVAYFTASGIQNMGSADSFGGVNRTTNSVAFEVTFDFTATVDAEVNPINLWEVGGSGTGSALVLQGDEVFFFASNSNGNVVSGNHGLSSPTSSVQIVSVFEREADGTNEVLSLYVNGNLVDSGSFATNNDWGGGENPGSGLGRIENTVRYNGSGLVNQGDVVVFPESNIDFAIYHLASNGGPLDNTLSNILVPEPTAALLGSLGLLGLLRRRR